MKVQIYTRRRYLGFGPIAYGWRLIAANGQVIATDGGQGYANEADLIQTLRSIRHPNKGIACAPIFNSDGAKVERWAVAK